MSLAVTMDRSSMEVHGGAHIGLRLSQRLISGDTPMVR